LSPETVLPLEYYWTISHLPAESQKSLINMEHIQLTLDSTDSTQNINVSYFYQLMKLPAAWQPITKAASTTGLHAILFIIICVGAQTYICKVHISYPLKLLNCTKGSRHMREIMLYTVSMPQVNNSSSPITVCFFNVGGHKPLKYLQDQISLYQLS
jgi:hypothetical protein